MVKENKVYALVLEIACWSAFVIILILFALYVSGILKPSISFDQLPRAWSLGVEGLTREYDRPLGWKWLLYLDKADFLCYIGLTILLSATIAALFSVLFVFIKQKNPIFTALVLCELLIMLLAASGIVSF